MNFEEIASTYIELRDAKVELERVHAEALRPINDAMEEAEQVMLGHLNTMGVQSLRTAAGTMLKVKQTRVRVGDWDSTWRHIESNKLWHLLEHRVSKTAVEGYISEHGEPPPGVDVTMNYTVQFRRS